MAASADQSDYRRWAIGNSPDPQDDRPPSPGEALWLKWRAVDGDNAEERWQLLASELSR